MQFSFRKITIRLPINLTFVWGESRLLVLSWNSKADCLLDTLLCTVFVIQQKVLFRNTILVEMQVRSPNSLPTDDFVEGSAEFSIKCSSVNMASGLAVSNFCRDFLRFKTLAFFATQKQKAIQIFPTGPDFFKGLVKASRENSEKQYERSFMNKNIFVFNFVFQLK